LLIALAIGVLAAADRRGQEPEMSTSTLLVLFDNNAAKTGLKYGWGLSILVCAHDTTLLFDTGADGKTLLGNMATLGVSSADVDAVFLSHDHWDHVGGLAGVLAANPDVDVHLTPAFSQATRSRIARAGARVVEHGSFAGGELSSFRVAPGMYSTGALEGPPEEHALVLEAAGGVVLVTGCSHPGIGGMVELVRERFGEPIRLVTGGYHLLHESPAEVDRVIGRFRELGVGFAAPIHCTGARARRMFKAELSDSFLEVGVGSKIDLTRD
jgi:7,8-dihydropterin-6-yl-methyl-4-(beta-D-ribofuranosyl)aminobenzene 5'-phosphate synthase